MGKTYEVPRSAKGESRFLYIFTVMSTITTIIGAIIGFVFYKILSIIRLGSIGLIVFFAFALMGYVVGTFTIPDSPIVGGLRKAGGEKISDILVRTLTFYNRKKIYVYRKGEDKK